MRQIFIKFLFLVFACASLTGADKEGGIIGTGVVGQITGLNQFEVSGMQFELDRNIPLVGLSSLQELEMGMTLAVRARREGDDWFATQIRRVHIAIGPITSDSEVMGIPVIGELPDAKRVSIDGFWSEDGIVATRIEVAENSKDSLTGPIAQIQRVGELVFINDDNSTIGKDRILKVSGTYNDGQFVVDSADNGLFEGAMPNLLMAEGYFSEPDGNGQTRFLGTGAQSAVGNIGNQDLKTKSTRCSFNGRIDFEFDEIPMPERETAVSLCINLPR